MEIVFLTQRSTPIRQQQQIHPRRRRRRRIGGNGESIISIITGVYAKESPMPP